MAKHVVALSGGKDSTAMALRLVETEPREYQFICTPTGDELPEMSAHWQKLESLLASPLVRLPNQTLSGLIQEMNALPNWRQRWCTRILKIEPMLEYMDTLPAGSVLYVGLRADEEERLGLKEEGVTVRFPMREWGWGIQDVWDYLHERDVCIPKRTDCARCFYQTLSEWRDLWANYPELYADAERQEEIIGHTFRSPGRDTWPAALKDLRKEFERGRALRISKREKQCRVCSL